jgi:hypothetical protein
MKADSLWYEVHMTGRSTAEVTLRRCPNCGEIKVLSPMCSLDHMAAVNEFRAAAENGPARTTEDA